jgi:divinyl chlorophyllide a 8-vinyl-reductase
VRELVSRGYNVVAFSRERSGVKGKADMEATRKEFPDADVRFGEVTDKDSLRSVGFKDKVDVVVSCLASRTGGIVSAETNLQALTLNDMSLFESYIP